MSQVMNKIDIYHQYDQQDIVEQHAPLVKKIAYHLKNRLPANILVDDLIQAGMIGLLEASKHYDASKGASFATYASIRVRGAMLDDIRKNDWAPRSVHRNSRLMATVIRKIENEQGRDARDSEIAQALDLSMREYNRMLQDSTDHKLLSMDELSTDSTPLIESLSNHKNEPLDELQHDNTQKLVTQAIASLPERERLVMALYYDEELNLREIGAIIGVTESRVSQIHSQAIIRLQARLVSEKS